ncbi:hypothetical protein GCM10010394_48480 [Streptomyces crystallinus]|uniref:Uncharacterized protein n=1 Tax=Streptomyces crystallinus TaxID=68191 RepID=A0ABP3RN59_9ACTN
MKSAVPVPGHMRNTRVQRKAAEAVALRRLPHRSFLNGAAVKQLAADGFPIID